MSLQNDTGIMAENLKSEGADLAAPNVEGDAGLKGHGEDMKYHSNVPDLVGVGRRFGPSPTLSSHGDVHGGAPLQSKPDWSSGYTLEFSGRAPRSSTEHNDDPGVYRTAMCMILPAVLPAMSLASSFSRAAVERA